jgi:hypothetical protein
MFFRFLLQVTSEKYHTYYLKTFLSVAMKKHSLNKTNYLGYVFKFYVAII